MLSELRLEFNGKIVSSVLKLVTYVVFLANAAPTSANNQTLVADPDKIFLAERVVQRRISGLLERLRVASGRAEVGLLRIFAELERGKLATNRSVATIEPHRVRIFDPQEHKERDSAVNLAKKLLIDVRKIEDLAETLLAENIPETNAVGVPEWSDWVYRELTESGPLDGKARSKLTYLERLTLAVEQSVQRTEVFEELSITLANRSRQTSEADPEANNAWRFLGPSVVLGGEGHNGTRVPVSGRITSVEVNADFIYVGAALGGVWRSRDAGATWEPVSDQAPSLAIGALALDPMKPDRIFAGTGEANVALRSRVVVGDRKLSGDKGIGLLVSEDSGDSWVVRGEEHFNGAAFAQIAVSKTSAGTVLVATTAGAFRSLDSGRTWQEQTYHSGLAGHESAVTSAVLHPLDSDRAWIAVWGLGLFSTTNFSAEVPKWTRTTKGLPLSNIGRIELAISVSDPETLYALYGNADHFLRGLYFSSDGGLSWDQIETAPDILQGQGFYNMLVEPDPGDANRVFLGGVGPRPQSPSSLYVGTRGFHGWEFKPIGGELHVDFHDIAFDPNNYNNVYVVNDGGIWRSKNGGEDWDAVNHGLGITQIISIDSKGRDTQRILVAGSQDNGTIVHSQGTEWVQGDGGDGGRVLIDPHDASVVYSVFFAERLNRSASRGKPGTFVARYPKGVRTTNMALLAPFDVNRFRNGEILLGADQVYSSSDSGLSWERVNTPVAARPDGVRKSVISALKFLHADLAAMGTSDGRIFLLSRGSTGEWSIGKELAQLSAASEPLCFISDIAPISSSNIFFVAASEGDCRGLWSIDPNGFARNLYSGSAFTVEVVEETLFVGTETGVKYRSSDDQWLPFGELLPSVAVFDLLAIEEAKVLRAGTFGRGVWEISTKSVVRSGPE